MSTSAAFAPAASFPAAFLACAAGSASFKEDIKKEQELLAYTAEQLSCLPGIHLNGAHAAPHVLNIGISGVPTQNSINILQDHGICVSAGSACAKGHRSHVLDAMKVDPDIIDGSFRISLCRDTTKEELDTLICVIREEILPRAR
jgi:cysteine desulfurase